MEALNLMFPSVFPLIGLWFLIAAVFCAVKLSSLASIQDLAQRGSQKKKALNIVLYPILAFVLAVVFWGLLNMLAVST